MDDFKKYLEQTGEAGYVEEVSHSIARVSGLPGAKLSELIYFETGEMGQVMTLTQEFVEVLVFARTSVQVGTRVARSGEPLKIAVGDLLIGKIMDALGRWVGRGEKQIPLSEWREVDVAASGISARKKVSRPLETGMILVDLLIPLGQGQRELVMGDRKTGKTGFVLQSLLTQLKLGRICVYAAIGKKNIEIKQAEEFFVKNGVDKNLIIVASSSHDSVGEIYLTPYTALTIAEYFRDKGKDVLVVLDDMTAHARFYRELALTARRFPGRESYPGDIFHVHSKLMERAGNFIIDGGEASITCLPVIDTVQGDVTGYIQTNLMSMTDGHIYFDSDLYFAGRRPAINPFISVTRVGYQTQSPIRRQLGGEIIKKLNDYEKIQNFVRFGAELGESTRQTLATGNRLLKLFNQSGGHLSLSTNVQTVAAALTLNGIWEGGEIGKLQENYEKIPALRKEIDDSVEKATTIDRLLALIKDKVDFWLKGGTNGQ